MNLNLKEAAGKIKPAVKSVRTNWNTPPEGKYIPYREFTAYSVGGIGVNTINKIYTYVELKSTCFLTGSAYNIMPVHLQIMNIIMSIIGIVKAPFMSFLIDNTKSKYGKFRPYLLYMGFPTVIFLIYTAFINPEMEYMRKCVTISLSYAGVMIFQDLYLTAFNSLGQVLTPNGPERTSLLSISAIVYNFGPSVVDILLPVLSSKTGGMTKVFTYKLFFPIFTIPGVFLGLLAFKNTKEKIIVPKDYVAKVKFLNGLSQVSGNKYFWLITSANILGALRGANSGIIGWYCVYQIKKDYLLGLMNAIMGTASVPGMLLAPLLEKKFGKKKSLIYGYSLTGIANILMLFVMNRPAMFFPLMYLSKLGTGGEYVLTQSMWADVYDYHQLKTGKRLEGFMNQSSGMLGKGLGLATGLILPAFYQKYGLKDDYEVLNDAAVRAPIFKSMAYASVISNIVGTLPFLFYKLTEKRHDEIIEELKEMHNA
ncbi:MAG: MFS transporter [Oscillospiraceae bacterium]|nr:MFS transporter [Oscillospiraceae bacterium]